MTTLLVLNIKLSGSRSDKPWLAQVEVPGSFTLIDLHLAIQRLIDFDDDHLHEFFVGRNQRDRQLSFGEPAETAFEDNESEKVALSEIFPLPKGCKLFYNFDFGDDWLFEITRQSGEEQTGRKRRTMKLIHEKGRRPVQYA